MGVGLTLAVMLLMAPVGEAGTGNLIRGSVVGNGGVSTPTASDGVWWLVGTVGQSATGIAATPNLILCSGFWCFGGPRVLAADPPGPAPRPAEFALGPATPNPTRDVARFRLALPRAATVSLAVFDVSGRQVGDEVSRSMEAGEHELSWRAPEAHAGVYFMRLSTDGTIKAKRTIVLVR